MPERNLRVALIPHAIVENDIATNMEQIAERFRRLEKGVDLIVLPELCFTGFYADREVLERQAEYNDGRCIGFIREWSRKLDAAIWGGFLAKEADGTIYNRGFMVSPDGDARFYDKRHLFCSGGERAMFERGMDLPPTVEFRTWKLRMAICYDIRFPVWNRCIGLNYDVLVVPANWPNSRYFSWRHILLARAIENQTYIAACDREGEDQYGKYERNDSMILDHWGQDIAETTDDGTMYATFDADALTRDRARFTPWRDSDDFNIIID